MEDRGSIRSIKIKDNIIEFINDDGSEVSSYLKHEFILDISKLRTLFDQKALITHLQDIRKDSIADKTFRAVMAASDVYVTIKKGRYTGCRGRLVKDHELNTEIEQQIHSALFFNESSFRQSYFTNPEIFSKEFFEEHYGKAIAAFSSIDKPEPFFGYMYCAKVHLKNHVEIRFASIRDYFQNGFSLTFDTPTPVYFSNHHLDDVEFTIEHGSVYLTPASKNPDFVGLEIVDFIGNPLEIGDDFLLGGSNRLIAGRLEEIDHNGTMVYFDYIDGKTYNLIDITGREVLSGNPIKKIMSAGGLLKDAVMVRKLRL